MEYISVTFSYLEKWVGAQINWNIASCRCNLYKLYLYIYLVTINKSNERRYEFNLPNIGN